MTEQEEPSQLDPYYRAASYRRERAALNAYQGLQDLLNREECDLSAYRLMWLERWHVVALGQQPPEHMEQRIISLLSSGQSASLPEALLRELQRRRAQSIRLGPWVERHYFPR